MLPFLYVGLGGALGSVGRFWLSQAIAARYGNTFPYETLAVNVAGSFVIGLLAALSLPNGRFLLTPSARLFFMVGICGGFTTFSAFSLETYALAQNGEWLRAAVNSFLSMFLCLAAVALGQVAGLFLNSF